MHLERFNLQGLVDGAPAGAGGVRQLETTRNICLNMGGQWEPYSGTPGFNALGTCYIGISAPAPAPAPVPAPQPITVSPQIQTAVSPQISPVFQQAFQPSGSPMTAGTTQTMPTSQSGTAPPPPGPDYAALMAAQQKMYESMLTRVTQPVQQQAPAPMPEPLYTGPTQPMVSYTATPVETMPIIREPLTPQAPEKVPLQKSNFMPIILAIGALGLVMAMRPTKGRKHAT